MALDPALNQKLVSLCEHHSGRAKQQAPDCNISNELFHSGCECLVLKGKPDTRGARNGLAAIEGRDSLVVSERRQHAHQLPMSDSENIFT